MKAKTLMIREEDKSPLRNVWNYEMLEYERASEITPHNSNIPLFQRALYKKSY